MRVSADARLALDFIEGLYHGAPAVGGRLRRSVVNLLDPADLAGGELYLDTVGMIRGVRQDAFNDSLGKGACLLVPLEDDRDVLPGLDARPVSAVSVCVVLRFHVGTTPVGCQS